jgi:uncharacterized protein (TIGR03437 family)
VQIILQSGAVYIPGVKQRITVRVEDPDQQRWGFELTARLKSDPEKSQAGEFTPIDNMTQIICEDAGPKPCSGGAAFITHTAAGTRPGTRGGANFQFDWTPPADNAGPITLYVAGNAANNDQNFTGDQIYTASVDLLPLNPSAPTIAPGQVVVMATGAPGNMAPNSWITVSGTNLGVTTRSWSEDDFVNGGYPYSLDGVSAILTSLGVPRLAYVGYVSPKQVNVLLPIDAAPGPTTLQIRNSAGISAAVPITIRPVAPQLLTVDGTIVNALHLDGSAVTKSSPAKPGETIKVYATGLGQTDPPMVTALQLPVPTPLAAPAQVVIDGATTTSSALATPSPGIYELTVQVPTTANNGDLRILCQIGATASNPALLTVQR